MRAILCVLVGLVLHLPAGAAGQSDAATATGDPLPRRGFLAERFGPVDVGPGARVVQLGSGSAAELAGLGAGDVIVAVGGVRVDPWWSIEDLGRRFRAGAVTTVEFVRDGVRGRASLQIPPLPAEEWDAAETRLGSVRVDAGYRVRTIVTRPTGVEGPRPTVFVAPWLSCDSVEAPFGPGEDGMLRLLHELATASDWVTVRVDRPGVGDSEGPSCDELDFDQELAAYRSAFEWSIRHPWVDRRRIVILGLSNGGGYAPLLASPDEAAAFVVVGGWSGTWLEHMLEHERTRLALAGATPAEVNAAMRGFATFYDAFLNRGLTPAEVLSAHPHLADLWYGEPEHLYGRPAAYHQQLQALNLDEAWAGVDVPVLAVWGTADWIMGRNGHERIVSLVNRSRSGLARLEVIDGMDHFLSLPGTAQASFDGVAAEFARPALDAILRFLEEIEVAGHGSTGPDVEIVVPDRPIPVLAELALVEPYPAVDPADPDHVVVGAIAASAEGREGRWTCVALTTFDAGTSWSTVDLDIDRCIDPWVVFDDAAVIATGIELGRGDRPRFALIARRSEDGGASWPHPAVTWGEPHDHPVIIRSGSGSLMMASRQDAMSASGRPRHTLHIGASTDGGRTMSRIARLTTSNLAQNATGIAQLDDSTVVVSYWDYQRDADGFEGEGVLARGRAWAIRSTDGGRSFSEPLFVTDECESGSTGLFPGYPQMVSAPQESPFGGALFHVCAAPGLNGVALASSSDRGERWSEPILLGARSRGAIARTPMAAVTADGTLGIAWYGAEPRPSGHCQHVYFAASEDGGRTTSEPIRVSQAESCPGAADNGWISNSWPMGGDYGSLVARPDGSFLLVWADSREGRFGLRFAILRVYPGR